jgi:hypothetical protein
MARGEIDRRRPQASLLEQRSRATGARARAHLDLNGAVRRGRERALLLLRRHCHLMLLLLLLLLHRRAQRRPAAQRRLPQRHRRRRRCALVCGEEGFGPRGSLDSLVRGVVLG